MTDCSLDSKKSSAVADDRMVLLCRGCRKGIVLGKRYGVAWGPASAGPINIQAFLTRHDTCEAMTDDDSGWPKHFTLVYESDDDAELNYDDG